MTRTGPVTLSLLLLTSAAACSNDPPGLAPGGSSPTPLSDGAAVARALARERVVIPNPGTIEGHVRLDGRSPGNRVIRMNMDPRCAEITEGQIVIQAEVVTTDDGDLSNVFVYLEGDLPALPPPAEPVRIDQQGCVYVPRVVGVQIGQTLEISNSDDLTHNVHSSSRVGNGFNVGQPRAGFVNEFQPGAEEVMMKVGCDLHRWMVGYVGILDHPYFAVTAQDGTFTIGNLPPGTYTIHTWHEIYGDHSETIEVRPDAVTRFEAAYTAE